jgi:hypothetical protein
MLCGVAICGCFPFSLQAAAAKKIRLRNEIITTSPAAKTGQAAHPVVSGLFLVQLTGPPDQLWRAQLQQLNVTLLRSVPEDAFVARMQDASLARVRALPFVHWIGEYRPEHKVHHRLQLAEKDGDPSPASVRILLAPDMRALELIQVRRRLRFVARESKSRFGTVLEGQATPEQLNLLAQSSAVLWIEPAHQMKLLDEVSSKIVAGGDVRTGQRGDHDDADSFGIGLAGVRTGAGPGEINAHATITQQLGFDGRGVTVAVADSGLQNGDVESMHPDLKGRVDAFFFYGKLEDAADEHSHGTHVTGIIAGDGAIGEMDDFGALYGLGLAPQAHIVAQRIFDGIGNYEAPPTFETLTRDAVRAGAVIGSNSWGDDTQGRYDLSAAEFDACARRGRRNQATSHDPGILRRQCWSRWQTIGVLRWRT